ncbi:MAG: hypothetical protein ABUS56_01565 [Acidobacteriota bacterium]
MTRPARARRALLTGTLAVLGWCGAPVRAAAQDSHLLVITGVSGDAAHAAQFHKWASALVTAAIEKDGVPADHITYLAEDVTVDAGRIRARSTRPNVEKAVADLAKASRPGDPITIVLIGHGAFDGKVASFNLPGPDLTAGEWATLLGTLAGRQVAFVDTTASSGPFVAAVAAPGRTVVTATKTGGERNEPQFGAFFTEAFGEPSADADRNGHVSIFEAFTYANNKVAKVYEQAGLLRTEHATLEDGHDGVQAATQFLTAHPSDGGLQVDTTDPVMRALVAEREALQRDVDALKLRKSTLDPSRYEHDMEALLTDLALKTKAIRDLQAQHAPRK